MRNVKRAKCPNSLLKNSTKWEQQLKAEISRCKGLNIRVDEKFFNRYNKKDVKNCLSRMYKNYCCYCESRINVVDYPHIEHRIPKRKYPDKCFEWENLHLACTKCNGIKGEKYNEEYSILDATLDIPIDDHLTYAWSIDTIMRRPKTNRGETTINHTKLNRQDLVQARFTILVSIMDVIDQVNQNPGTPDSRFKKKELYKRTSGEYGTIISWAMISYLK